MFGSLGKMRKKCGEGAKGDPFELDPGEIFELL